MIASDSDLKVVQRQLDRVECALAALKRDVLPKSAEWFALMADAYCEEISRLRVEIDEYTGAFALAELQSDIVVRLEGDGVRLGEAPGSLIDRAIRSVRNGVGRIGKAFEQFHAPPTTTGPSPAWNAALYDPPVIAVATGSIRIRFGTPTISPLFAEQDEKNYRAVLDLFSAGLLAASEGDATRLKQICSSPAVRDSALDAVGALISLAAGSVKRVTLAGRRLAPISGGAVCLTAESRARLDAVRSRVPAEEKRVTLRGVIREVDLDAKTFDLRERPGDSPAQKCRYHDTYEEQVVSSLARPVMVTGVETKPEKGKARFLVEEIQVIEE
ncbi:MAG: hypothetical protein HY719_09205 [Planctomycetes bacterium]|nr:hypothetical protein [Planctomycetota bacterium]